MGTHMMQKFWLGNLTLDAIPFDNPIIRNADLFMIGVALLVLATITFMGKWRYLWSEWLTSVDHKKIGMMYIILAFVMLLRGFADAVLMRSQQMLSVGSHYGFLPAEHYSQIFTAHGVIMIFFMAMPFMFGLINLILPIQIGARDVAFPYLNSLSLWLTVISAMLVNVSLVIGEFAKTGWLAYPPLSGIHYSPGVGVDYYIWAVQISGVGSLLSAVNFFVTIIKMRCPGMTFMRMPVFVWTVLCAMILVMLAFPVLTVTLALLFLDRFAGMHFFTIGHGGNAMMYINLIWAWGHPEVYILILPAFGIYSEVVQTFCKKKLFGYTTMVGATVAITFLSFIVWLHHFFTMGAGANVNAFFGITTMIIAVPTGVKVFNWLFTMYKGRITYSSPMIFTVAFMLTFVIGGMTGVMMAVPAVDFQLHNSVFLVAHFHNAIIGGVVFGYLAGLTFWFPKIFGFKLNEQLGKLAACLWFIGFFVAFTPLYILGLKGMTRRLYHYPLGTGWHPYLVVAAIGSAIVGLAVVVQLIQLVVSIKNRDKPGYKVTSGDAWENGRSLEWSIPCPAPFYNFAVTPVVHTRDEWWEHKQRVAAGEKMPEIKYSKIHMPRNTGVGFIIGVFSFIFGFAMIWHITWLSILGLVGVVLTAISRTFNRDVDYYVEVPEIEKIENAASSGRV
jgi:cytochrome o ubiquinol oxidase subunit 1